MKCAYVRASSERQKLDRQRLALEAYDIDKWFEEKASGKDISGRPVFQEMLNFVREGDIVYVTELSRLGRSTKDLLQTFEFFEKKGVRVQSLKENIDTSTISGRFMITVLSAIAEFERETIKERQREGIRIAKEKGKYKKRTKKYNTEKFEELYKLYKSRDKYNGKNVTISLIADELEVSRPFVYKIISKKEESKDERKE